MDKTDEVKVLVPSGALSYDVGAFKLTCNYCASEDVQTIGSTFDPHALFLYFAKKHSRCIKARAARMVDGWVGGRRIQRCSGIEGGWSRRQCRLSDGHRFTCEFEQEFLCGAKHGEWVCQRERGHTGYDDKHASVSPPGIWPIVTGRSDFVVTVPMASLLPLGSSLVDTIT